MDPVTGCANVSFSFLFSFFLFFPPDSLLFYDASAISNDRRRETIGQIDFFSRLDKTCGGHFIAHERKRTG